MTTTSSVSQKTITKFYGRKASPCRRCGGLDHYVNRMGGIVCYICSPPRDEQDVRGELTVECGVWIDPENRFETWRNTRSGGIPAAGPTAPATAPAARPSNDTPGNSLIWDYYSRGPRGEWSEFEIELAASDEIWQSQDELIVLKYSSKKANQQSLEWLGPNTATSKLEGQDEKKKAKNEDQNEKGEEQSSRGEIACRGALQDRIEAVAPSAQSRRSGCEGEASQDSGEVDLQGMQIGEVVKVTRRVETFRGPLRVLSEYRLVSAWRDHFGRQFVNLADAKGELVVSGLDLGGIRKA